MCLPTMTGARRDANTRPSALGWFMPTCYALHHRDFLLDQPNTSRVQYYQRLPCVLICLQVLQYNPLYAWTLSPEKACLLQQRHGTDPDMTDNTSHGDLLDLTNADTKTTGETHNLYMLTIVLPGGLRRLLLWKPTREIKNINISCGPLLPM